MGAILGSIAGGTLPNGTLQELLLPLKVENENSAHFGIGITSAFHSRNTTYLATRISTAPTVLPLVQVIPTTQGGNGEEFSQLDSHGKQTLTDLCEQIDTAETCKLEKTQSWEECQGPSSQKDLPDLVNKSGIAGIKPANDCEKLYCVAQAVLSAKDWLKCSPSKSLLTYISNRDYRAWFSFKCRRPLANINTTSPRANCPKEIDIYGDHLLHCKYSARSTFSPMIRRHEAQVRLLFNDRRAAIRNPILEPRDHTTTHHLRPDIMAFGPHGQRI